MIVKWPTQKVVSLISEQTLRGKNKFPKYVRTYCVKASSLYVREVFVRAQLVSESWFSNGFRLAADSKFRTWVVKKAQGG